MIIVMACHVLFGTSNLPQQLCQLAIAALAAVCDPRFSSASTPQLPSA
jgi:hypothetical protein